jgi:hypothetical protein
MKSFIFSKAALLAAIVAVLVDARAGAAESVTDAADLIRSIHKTDREALLAEEMRLNEKDSAAFWPVYRAYRAEMDKLGDRLVNLVLEYRDIYPNVSDEHARVMLREYADLEKKILDTRGQHLKRATKELSAAKALRWAQLESRMDLLLRLQLASAIPLVPDKRLGY